MTIIQNVAESKSIRLGNSDYCVGGRKRLRDSVNTPNYASVTFKKLLPENPYSDAQHKVEGSPGRVTTTTKYVWYEWVGPNYVRKESTSSTYSGRGYGTLQQIIDALSPYASTTLSTMPSEATLRNETLMKVLSDISDAKTNLPVLAAEAAKTSNLILGTANKLYRAMRAVRRGRFGEASTILDMTHKKAHNNWLAYKYGWMPLLSDVKNSAEFFAQQMYGRLPVFDVKRSTTVKGSKSDPVGTYGWTGRGLASGRTTCSAERRYTIKATVRLENPNLAATQQLGLTNPLLVAWELVPYSFVFDWFIGVGDYLQAISALHGVTVVKAMSSKMDLTTTEQTISETPYAYYSSVDSAFTTRYKVEARSYTRGSTSISPTEVVPVRNRDPWNFSRVVTSLALLKSRSSRDLRI